MFCKSVRIDESNTDGLGLIIEEIDLTEQIEDEQSSQSIPLSALTSTSTPSSEDPSEFEIRK